ncbi:hypothetical protein ACIBHY_33355 [Nonomuraea sp. NPDC050547]|uniref:hypothetical protein n=1 Tax=Nonomuraea sp. NPDC050547 TaxID=3364368 RepID=UPI00379794A8
MSIDLGPYTYVTLTMTPDKTPHLNVTFHSNDLWIRNNVLDDARPLLTIRSREADVSLSTSGAVTDTDLSIARTLAASAARYLADCERLHATQNTADTPAAALTPDAAG